jgi:quercetin dioxygenase-like cupin family protein
MEKEMTQPAADFSAGAPTKKPARMEIFQGPGEELGPDAMPFVGMDETVMAGFAKLMESGAAPSAGESVRCLFREPQGRYSLCQAWFKSGFIVPRHSHDADCLYYIIAGELKMGSKTLRKGEGAFVPADHAYTFEAGPEGVELLEFRNATNFHFRFRSNDEAHWDRMAGVYRDRAEAWPNETIPPSDRTVAAE